MRQELKRFPVYRERFPVYDETFEELWVFASTVANKHHFQPVKVTLEHSKDGDHEARVRFHIFICANIKERERFHEDPESENDFFQPVQVVRPSAERESDHDKRQELGRHLSGCSDRCVLCRGSQDHVDHEAEHLGAHSGFCILMKSCSPEAYTRRTTVYNFFA